MLYEVLSSPTERELQYYVSRPSFSSLTTTVLGYLLRNLSKHWLDKGTFGSIQHLVKLLLKSSSGIDGKQPGDFKKAVELMRDAAKS